MRISGETGKAKVWSLEGDTFTYLHGESDFNHDVPSTEHFRTGDVFTINHHFSLYSDRIVDRPP